MRAPQACVGHCEVARLPGRLRIRGCLGAELAYVDMGVREYGREVGVFVAICIVALFVVDLRESGTMLGPRAKENVGVALGTVKTWLF